MTRSLGPFADVCVLVVEDSPFMNTLLYEMLRALGVGQVVRARSAHEAKRRLVEYRVDCAIVDWMMGPPSGFDVLKALRASHDPQRQDLPVVMCSAYTDRKRVWAMVEAGANGVLAKPISAASLYDKLASALFEPRARLATAADVAFAPSRAEPNDRLDIDA